MPQREGPLWTRLLLTVAAIAAIGQVCTGQRRTKRTAIIPGDIMIGALFSVHHQPGQKQAQSRTCGDIREQYGLQRVEASFQTIDEINRNETLLPNITLGIEIRDSCWYSPIALDQSIEFIRDAIKLDDIQDGNLTATHADVLPDCAVKPAKTKKNLVGVVGPGSSTVTIQVQNLLQLFNIPQIGYSATSRDLSDKSFYKYFLRVVPSDFYQAQVMVDLVRAYNWTYVSTVHTDGNYGGSGMDDFVKLAHEAGICVAASDSILSHAEDYYFDQIIRNLQKYPNAKVVVCFCEGMTVRGLLKAIRRLNATGEFLLIGSDGWSDRNDVTEEYEKEALGGISIRIHSTYDHSFNPYYFSLKPLNNSRNPWFKEFWEYRFNCSLPNGSGKYNKTCSGNEDLRERYKQDTKMSFVKKAIYTMAYGLHDMQKAKCNNSGLCPEMLPLNGSLFLQYLLNVSFVWENETVKFDENGDPPGRYDIMNFQFIPENNSYDYKHVGSWDSGVLDIFQSFRWNPKHIPNGLTVPESVCSKPCEKGKVKSIQSESVKCCWVCVACKENQFLEDEFTCKDCELGWWPNENLTDCDRIPVDYIQWSDSTAIVSVTIAVLGMIATFFTMVVFIRHNNTPVVKASTRELSYVILVGMYFCHSCTFPLLAKPTHTSCFLTRIMPGLSFAMMYASLVTKTNRIARILAGSKKKIITKKPRCMSGTAQVVITWLLISIESSIIGAMLVLEPADSMYSYPSLDKVELVCNTTPLGIIAPLGFDFFLIAMCTVYAVKTRNVPENFNEAKFIGFTMYTTLVIWVAFVPIYFGSNSKVITLCLCISFSAIVALVLLFFPKLYIILLRPEKNNRSAFTTTKDVRCHIGRGYPSAATVSRNSSHSTSEFSLESPRNLSLDLVHKNTKPEPTTRRPSMNLFVRLRISKQDKIAANVAQHIRAVRAAEALDRRTRLRRTDSFNFPGLPSTILPVQRSTSSGEDSPAGHDKKRLVGMIKQAYAEEVIEEMRSQAEDVACQTSYDLLEALLPSLRRRVVRSETSMTTDDEDLRYSGTPCKMGACHHKRPAYSDGGRHYSLCDPTHGAMNAAYDTTSFTSRSSCRPRSRNRHRSDGREDRIEVEYKIPSDSDLLDYDVEEVISLKEMKKSKAMQLLSKKGQYNKLQAMIGDGTSLCLPHEGASEASFSPTVSQDSLIDATSSIVEESASTGSDETSGSAVYKNIIINLGGNQDRRPFSASQSSTTSAANLSILPTILDSRISHSQENVNDGGKRSPDVSKWASPNGNPKGLAM